MDIRAGDVFQVNLAQRLLFPEQEAAPLLYLRLRNDLSPVCRPENVCVTQLCGLEIDQYVQHLA